jgi:hypothetical protein
MRKFAIAVVPIFLCLTGCAFFKSKPPPPAGPRPPHFAYRTATLDITDGIRVTAAVKLPNGFAPSSASPPMWLAQGKGVAVAGTLDQKTVVLGFSGDRLTDMATIASDFGPGAPAGRILEVAASADGMELATAVAATDAHRLDLMVIDSISGGQGHSVASFNGDYRVASLNWLDRTTIAIVLQTQEESPAATNADASASGLYAVDISGLGSVAHFDQLHCGLDRMSFSPDRRYAVSEGDRDLAPAIVELSTQACAQLRATGPIEVLGWAPDSSSFLYSASSRDGSGAGAFRFTVATAQRKPIAVSSTAAAYVSDGTIIAMGNAQLSWKHVAQAPNAPVKAEIALLNPLTAEVTINSLGFRTPPVLFARSTMVLAPASDNAAITTFVPAADGVLRELINYSYPSRNAFVLASGRVNGSLAMSWSGDGRALAIVDGDASLAWLTVLIPPQ